MTRYHETPLVPPLGEATVTDWIRHHMARTTGESHADLAEVEQAARSKMLDAFHDARVGLASFTLSMIGNRNCIFRDARLARLRMGHLRYGVCGVNRYDAIGSCLRRLEEYAAPDGGNLEHLVDIANLCEIEYWWPQREGAEWCRNDCSEGRRAFSDVRGMLDEGYRLDLCLTCLAHAVNLCEAEFLAPTHPKAHWEAQDCGGHWSLRNQGDAP